MDGGGLISDIVPVKTGSRKRKLGETIKEFITQTIGSAGTLVLAYTMCTITSLYTTR